MILSYTLTDISVYMMYMPCRSFKYNN